MKAVKTDYIQDYCKWKELLEYVSLFGLNSKYNLGKWEFIAKEHGAVGGLKIT